MLTDFTRYQFFFQPKSSLTYHRNYESITSWKKKTAKVKFSVLQQNEALEQVIMFFKMFPGEVGIGQRHFPKPARSAYQVSIKPFPRKILGRYRAHSVAPYRCHTTKSSLIQSHFVGNISSSVGSSWGRRMR